MDVQIWVLELLSNVNQIQNIIFIIIIIAINIIIKVTISEELNLTNRDKTCFAARNGLYSKFINK